MLEERNDGGHQVAKTATNDPKGCSASGAFMQEWDFFKKQEKGKKKSAQVGPEIPVSDVGRELQPISVTE